jgi:peptidoglycan/xylan/chitin deacetylase (PgdA/CDA1 family)
MTATRFASRFASRFSWPHGKRMAVLISVLLESWSDGKSPTYFTRTTPLRGGAVDHAGVQWSQYGGKEGIWRLIRTLDLCHMKASVFCNGRAAELYPDAIKQIVKSGHVVEGHGYAQDQYFLEMTPEVQRATIRKVLDILGDASGSRPQGWATPVYGWNEHTFDLLVAEGVKYYADALDCSLPRREKTASGEIVALPWSEFVDNRVLRASPRDFFDVYKDSFDYLYAHEPAGLLHLGIHSHFGAWLRGIARHKLLRYFSEFTDVWFPTHRELVQWFVDQKVEGVPYAQRFFS